MRRRLEDWESGESFATPYTRAQVERFSPRSKAILEIQSTRDLEILDGIQRNSMYLGDTVEFFQQFDMTGDSSLFPPLTQWERNGFARNEYGQWIDSSGALALPVYEGRMVGQFDPSEKRWVSGKGRRAVWESVDWMSKLPGPQYLMPASTFLETDKHVGEAAFYYMKISSATNSRTMIGSVLPDVPSVYSLCQLVQPDFSVPDWLVISGILNSFTFDFAVRTRLGGLNITGYILDETPIPMLRSDELRPIWSRLAQYVAKLSFASVIFAPWWWRAARESSWATPEVAWRQQWAVTPAERLRCRCIVDAVSAALFGLDDASLAWVLRDCDHPVGGPPADSDALDPKGFWRVQKEDPPELRHTVLTQVAFRDLQQRIGLVGDLVGGCAAFLDETARDAWRLPEVVRLADYGLGHDDRAREPAPVASRLGPRFYDWQLAQTAEESWRECEIHAKNLGPASREAPETSRDSAGAREAPLPRREHLF
jgi:hypothetical protein